MAPFYFRSLVSTLMAHNAAWEGEADQGEEAVEEAATTIFQKIVRLEK